MINREELEKLEDDRERKLQFAKAYYAALEAAEAEYKAAEATYKTAEAGYCTAVAKYYTAQHTFDSLKEHSTIIQGE